MRDLIRITCFFFFHGATTPSGPGPPYYPGFTITLNQTNHARWESSGRVIGPTQRSLPDTTQHSREKDIYAPGGIRIRYPSKPSAADPHLKPRGHWARLKTYMFRISVHQISRTSSVCRCQSQTCKP